MQNKGGIKVFLGTIQPSIKQYPGELQFCKKARGGKVESGFWVPTTNKRLQRSPKHEGINQQGRPVAAGFQSHRKPCHEDDHGRPAHTKALPFRIVHAAKLPSLRVALPSAPRSGERAEV